MSQCPLFSQGYLLLIFDLTLTFEFSGYEFISVVATLFDSCKKKFLHKNVVGVEIANV